MQLLLLLLELLLHPLVLPSPEKEGETFAARTIGEGE
jgi:hypothetical protein